MYSEIRERGEFFMSLIKCPDCGREISSKAVTCPYCGFPLLEIAKMSGFSQEVLENGTVICRKCGFSIPANHEYCDNCGELLDRNLEVSRNTIHPSDTLNKSETKHLQKILINGEQIRSIAKGILNSYVGILVCTNFRIFFLSRGLVYGKLYKEINLQQIDSIFLKANIIYSEVHIKSGLSWIIIKDINKHIGEAFVQSVNELKLQTHNTYTI